MPSQPVVVHIELVTVLTLAIIGICIVALVYMPWKKRTMASQLLVVFIFIVFIVHALFDKNILSFNFSMFGSGGPGVTTSFWDELAFASIWLKDPDPAYRAYTLLTSIFTHGHLAHLLGNIIFFIIFGVALEERIGTKRFIAVFFIAGIASSLLNGAFDVLFSGAYGFSDGSRYIGASAAISGIMGVMVVLYPHDKLLMPVGFFLMNAPVILGVGIYFVLETVLAFANPNDGIAHFGHIFGLLIGMVMAPLLASRIKEEREDAQKDHTDYELLRSMARTEELENLLKRIEEEDIKEVRQAWVESFLSKAGCPDCGKELVIKGKKATCECGFSTRI